MANDDSRIARLAGGVAHDFNNLLTSIKALSALALDELPADHPTRPDLEEIQRAAQRAVALTQQLLALSGRNVARAAPIDLNQIVRQMEPALRALVQGRAALAIHYAADATPIVADARHIDQILTNLVVNARESAGTDGSVEIEIGRDGDQAIVIVRDSGSPLEGDDVTNAFEPFWTTQDNRKLGLVLAAASSLAVLSGGSLSVRGGETARSALELRLPLADATPGSLEQPDPAAAQASPVRTILVVDDDASIRRLVVRILESGKYRVLVADSAERALELAGEAAGAVDLLLTDISMPGTGGLALQAALRQRWPRVRVLYMSGYTDDPAARARAGDPAGAYLSKPFGPEALLAAVRRVLDREP